MSRFAYMIPKLESDVKQWQVVLAIKKEQQQRLHNAGYYNAAKKCNLLIDLINEEIESDVQLIAEYQDLEKQLQKIKKN